jgi:hypothetical protein
MTPKMLKWWEAEWDKACILACYYNCCLSLDQFAASRGLEEEDRNILLEHLQKRSVCY